MDGGVALMSILLLVPQHTADELASLLMTTCLLLNLHYTLAYEEEQQQQQQQVNTRVCIFSITVRRSTTTH